MQICEVHSRAFYSREIWMQMRGTLENWKSLPVSAVPIGWIARWRDSREKGRSRRAPPRAAARRADKLDEKELPGKSRVPKSLYATRWENAIRVNDLGVNGTGRSVWKRKTERRDNDRANSCERVFRLRNQINASYSANNRPFQTIAIYVGLTLISHTL